MSDLPIFTQAPTCGGVSGFARLVGPLISYYPKLTHRIASGVMSFGMIILISAVAFALMDEAAEQGTLLPATIGSSLLDGDGVALTTVIGTFLSNAPEGPSSSGGMKRDGKLPRYVFILWFGIGIISVHSAFLGYTTIGGLSTGILSASNALVAEATLVVVVQTMVPKAFEDIHNFTGHVASAGFLLAFLGSPLLS